MMRLYELTEMHFRTMKYLMGRYPFHIMVGVFQITDIVCHRLWHRKDEILRAYRRVDQYLRSLAGEGNNVFVISDHGFREFPNRVLINQYLLNLGLLVKRRANRRDGLARGSSHIQDLRFGGDKGLHYRVFRLFKGFFMSLGLTRHRIIGFLKKTGLFSLVSQHSPRVMKRVFPPFSHDVDCRASRSFLHSSRTRSILINRNGLSEPSSYASLREELRGKLLALHDPRTGERAISRALFREEIYSGRYTEIMPDLYLEPADGYLIRSGFGDMVVDRLQIAKSSHDSKGIFMAMGPDIEKGRPIHGASLMDLAPTFLHILGLPIPSDMDGKVLLELFQKGSEPRRRRIRYTEPLEQALWQEMRLAPEHEVSIQDRLRALGYME
jgi:predicted AlkP superfamily phosphohydrolase/phosphomutase